MFDFEKLDVYQLSIQFCEEIEILLDKLPASQYRFADQLGRATLSIPLNIAEAAGRLHNKERKQFYSISRGSAFECVPLLTLLQKKRYLSPEEHSGLCETIVRLVQMLTKMIQKFAD